MSPAGPGPLSTLSRMGLNTLCMGMEVPLALVVFEDAENELVQPMDDAASSFTSFQMQPHPWQFMFKVRTLSGTCLSGCSLCAQLWSLTVWRHLAAQVRCVWVNGATQHALGVRSADEAVQHISTNSNKNTAMRCDLMGLLKGIEHGQGQAIKTWNTYVGAEGNGATCGSRQAALVVLTCMCSGTLLPAQILPEQGHGPGGALASALPVEHCGRQPIHVGLAATGFQQQQCISDAVSSSAAAHTPPHALPPTQCMLDIH